MPLFSWSTFCKKIGVLYALRKKGFLEKYIFSFRCKIGDSRDAFLIDAIEFMEVGSYFGRMYDDMFCSFYAFLFSMGIYLVRCPSAFI